MKTTEAHPAYSLRAVEKEGKELLLALAGRVSLADTEKLFGEMEALLDGRHPSAVTIDLHDVSYMDSAGVLALLRLEWAARKRDIPLALARVPDEIRGIVDLVMREGGGQPTLRVDKSSPGLFEAVGGVSLNLFKDFKALMTFLGDLVTALGQLLTRPWEVRWEDVLFCMRRTGVDGLPIVGLISLLIGLIIAFMSSLQLKQFGANVYVASLVAVAIVRELGPIMTAILVAGRSASAYAAEIGTMRVNDEVDALVTMGFDPIRFLAVPKVIATVLVLPLLTLYSDLFGIFGGMIVGVAGLDLTAYTYLQASQRSISVFVLLSSLVKAVAFAFVVAWIGCQRGFQVRGGVEEVGAATTSAVVTSILLIVVVDSVFAVVLQYIR